MRIAIFSDSINIPPKEGINVHTYELLCELARRDSVKPILFVCDRGWLDHDMLKQLPFDTLLIPESQFYDESVIAELLELYDIDIAQSYMTYFSSEVLGVATKRANIPMVAEFHDLEESIVPLYFDRHEVAEATKTHMDFQRKAARYASLVRTVSSFDLDIIKRSWQDYTPEKFFWMPVSRSVPEQKQESDRRTILYIGNMSYKPNLEGAEIIRDKVAGGLAAGGLIFVGRGSEKFASETITALGMVDDIDDILKHTAVGLSPIITGSGIKIKNLTYLSNGIPCISTHFGANSFPATEAIILEDDFSKWPAIIDRLLNDSVEHARLSAIALAYFKQYFDITSNTDQLIEKYQEAIDSFPQNVRSDDPKSDPIDMKHVYWLREVREHGTAKVSSHTYIASAGSRNVASEGDEL